MLCCGRRCGCITGPLRNYQAAFSSGQWMPQLKLTNNMNREAILQARLPLRTCSSGLDSSRFLFPDELSGKCSMMCSSCMRQQQRCSTCTCTTAHASSAASLHPVVLGEH